MPLLDTSIVLDDPMFNQKFQIRRTRKTITLGRVKHIFEIVDTDGVITAVKGEDLTRLPSADRGYSPIYVYCKLPLSIGDKDYAPDEILFRDEIWQVKEVNDWSEYGVGFYRALCIARDPTA